MDTVAIVPVTSHEHSEHANQAAMALRTFTNFSQLPTEIRRAIWKFTFVPRVVEIYYGGIYSNGGFSSDALPPIALEVCKESRDLALEAYPLCFGSIYHPAHIRFNLSLDVLLFDIDFQSKMPHLLGIMNQQEISGLRYLAIESDILEKYRPFRDIKKPLKRALGHLSGLKELLIVYDVSDMTSRIHSDDENGVFALYEELPAAVRESKELYSDDDPDGRIEDLPPAEEFEDIEAWSTPKCRPVYGWKRCTCSKIVDPPPEDDSEDSDMDGYGDDYWEDDDSDDPYSFAFAGFGGPFTGPPGL